MGARVPRYFSATDLGRDVCEGCEPSLIGILNLTEYKARAGVQFVCLGCEAHFIY